MPSLAAQKEKRTRLRPEQALTEMLRNLKSQRERPTGILTLIMIPNPRGNELRTETHMDQPTVLIISDEAEFSRVVMGRWQSERQAPSFTTMSSDVCLGFDPESFHLAIVGGIRPGALSVLMEAMDAAGKRAIFVANDASVRQTVGDRWPGVLALGEQENWLDILVMVSSEALHAAVAKAHTRCMEQSNAQLERQAMLGRYMLEMRHNLNNALTSVLGNSELLLLEPGSLSAGSRSQIETIRNMALRMHEVLQRFSSLEKELSVASELSERKTSKSAKAAAAAQYQQ